MVRNVKDLLTNRTQPATHSKIVIIGGQMSGVEIAGSIAFQLSSAVNTPGEPAIPDAAKYMVTHVVSKPVWTMPLFFPSNPETKDDDSQNKAS
jgi:hypothetical protein